MTLTIFDECCLAALAGAYTVLALAIGFLALAWIAKRLGSLLWDDDLRLPR
jgi:hypothetical protein